MSSTTIKTESPLAFRIVVAMALGVLAGVVFRDSMAPLGIVGKLFIQLIKVMAIPLVFFSILDAMITTQISWKSAGRLFLVVLINTSIALSIGLTLSNLVEPGRYFEKSAQAAATAVVPKVDSIDFAKVLSSVVPTSIVGPFAENNVISVVL